MFTYHDSIMLLIDPENGNIIDANISASKFYGYTMSELCSMNINQINTLSHDNQYQNQNQHNNNNNNNNSENLVGELQSTLDKLSNLFA